MRDLWLATDGPGELSRYARASGPDTEQVWRGLVSVVERLRDGARPSAL